MNTNNSMHCPVDFMPVNENKVRIVALQVFLISMIYVFTLKGSWIIFLVLDFFARGFGVNKLSLLSWIAEGAIKIFKIGKKPVDSAAKEFAARIGIILSLLIIVFHSGFPIIAMALGILLALFSFLEGCIAFCAGCYLYALGNKIFPPDDFV